MISKGKCRICEVRPYLGDLGICPECEHQEWMGKILTGVICKGCFKHSGSVIGKQWLCDNCKDKKRKYNKRFSESLKDQVVKLLGGMCHCCGENEPWALTVEPSRDKFRNGREWYSHILSGQAPNVRLLCWICKKGLQYNYGVCPHMSPIAHKV